MNTAQMHKVTLQVTHGFESAPKTFEFVCDSQGLANLIGRHTIKHGAPIEHKAKGVRLFEFYDVNSRGMYTETSIMYSDAAVEDIEKFKNIKETKNTVEESEQIAALINAKVVS